MKLSLFWACALVGCVRSAPIVPKPPAAVLPKPAPTYADSLKSAQNVLDAVAEDPGGTCESLILQWPKGSDGQEGQTLLYREAGCDLCVMTCISTVTGMVDEEDWKRDPASALQAVVDCIAQRCRTRAEVIP